MFTTRTHTKLNQIKIRQLFLTLFVLLPVLATSMAKSNNATAINRTQPTNANKIAVSSQPTPPIAGTSGLSTVYTWGHNTKYSTVIFDENIIVKRSTVLDIRYPRNYDLHDEYTIIGLYIYPMVTLDAENEKYSSDDFMVFIREGGIGKKISTVRFVSNIPDDVEFNLKIFGINV